MITKVNVNTLMWVGIGVLLTLQIGSCFRKTPVNAELIIAKEKIKSIEEKRVSDSISNAAYIKLKDENIALLQQKENVIVNQYIQSNDKLKTIPAIVNALVRDSLRRAIERYVVLSD